MSRDWNQKKVRKLHVTGIESKKVFKSLQKCIIWIAKKPEQFQKLNP